MNDPNQDPARDLEKIHDFATFAWRVTIAATLAGGFLAWWVTQSPQ